MLFEKKPLSSGVHFAFGRRRMSDSLCATNRGNHNAYLSNTCVCTIVWQESRSTFDGLFDFSLLRRLTFILCLASSPESDSFWVMVLWLQGWVHFCRVPAGLQSCSGKYGHHTRNNQFDDLTWICLFRNVTNSNITVLVFWFFPTEPLIGLYQKLNWTESRGLI